MVGARLNIACGCAGSRAGGRLVKELSQCAIYSWPGVGRSAGEPRTQRISDQNAVWNWNVHVRPSSAPPDCTTVSRGPSNPHIIGPRYVTPRSGTVINTP